MPYSDTKKMKIKQESGILKNILMSLFIGFFSFVAVLSIISIMLLKISTQNEYLYAFVLIASGISVIFGSVFACIFLSSRRLLCGMSISAVLGIVEFIILLCFNNVSLSNHVYFLFPIAIFCGFIGCVIGTNIKKK